MNLLLFPFSLFATIASFHQSASIPVLDLMISICSQIVMIAEACRATYLLWIEELFAERVSSNILQPILYAKQNTFLHWMLQRRRCGYESSSASWELHLPLMALYCCTVTAPVPYLKRKNPSRIIAPSIFCAAIIWYERSWTKITSSFRRWWKEELS